MPVSFTHQPSKLMALKPHRLGWRGSRGLAPPVYHHTSTDRAKGRGWSSGCLIHQMEPSGSSRMRVGTARERHSGQHVVSSPKEVTEPQESRGGKEVGGPLGFTPGPQVLAPSQHRQGPPWASLPPPPPSLQHSQLLVPVTLNALWILELPGTSPGSPEH